MEQNLPPELLARIQAVTAKRPRVVLEHILKHGYVTTAELESLYGYKHPPRAARDVREQGIPLETFKVKDVNGRTIAAYRFGDLSQIQTAKLGGRKVFPKELKTALYESSQGKCAVCNTHYEERYLQIDHRIPYEVSGDSQEITVHEFMLVCGSCNRAKSWSCEHCHNWQVLKQPDICLTCYWANPLDYQHIALQQTRRVDLTFDENEIPLYEQLKTQADLQGQNVSEVIKAILALWHRTDT